MIKKLFFVLFLFFASATVFAESSFCPYSINSLKSLNDIPKKKCTEVESSPQCQTFYAELLQTTDVKEVNRRKLTCNKTAWDILVSSAVPMPLRGSCQSGVANFAIGLVDSVVDTAKSAATSIAKTISCKNNPNEKRQLIAAKLATLPKLMTPPIPPKIMAYSCGDIESWFAFTERQNRIEQSRELLPKIRANRTLTPDEKETAYYLNLYSNGSEGHSIAAIATKLMKTVAGSAICYNSEYQTELYCEALATAASMVITSGGGTAAMAALRASRLERLAAMAGRKLSQAEIDALAQEALQAAKIKDLAGRKELVDKVAALEDADRIALAEKILGKQLTPDERLTLLKTHNLTNDELLRKAKNLQSLGLNKDQITVFMRSSITGQPLDPRTIAAIERLPASANKSSLLGQIEANKAAPNLERVTNLFKDSTEGYIKEIGNLKSASSVELGNVEYSASRWGTVTKVSADAARAKDLVGEAAKIRLDSEIAQEAARASKMGQQFDKGKYVTDYLNYLRSDLGKGAAAEATKFKIDAIIKRYNAAGWNLR